jgi:hypothetical protein
VRRPSPVLATTEKRPRSTTSRITSASQRSSGGGVYASCRYAQSEARLAVSSTRPGDAALDAVPPCDRSAPTRPCILIRSCRSRRAVGFPFRSGSVRARRSRSGRRCGRVARRRVSFPRREAGRDGGRARRGPRDSSGASTTACPLATVTARGRRPPAPAPSRRAAAPRDRLLRARPA